MMTLLTSLSPFELGNGQVVITPQHIQLTIFPNNGQTYHDAQVSDYAGLKRRNFPHRPPLKLSLVAHTSLPSQDLQGTLGFGFWNHPFMAGMSGLRLPRAIWFFFGAPPNNMPLAMGSRGHGWKAAIFDATKPLFFALLPFAPLGFLLMRIPRLYRLLWPLGQRSLGVFEQDLDIDIHQPHHYEIHWYRKQVQFWVDGHCVLSTPTASRGPLGFIAWVDNQYAIVTPQGCFGWGTVPLSQPQTLTISELTITQL